MNLTPYFNKLEYLRATAVQIQKDFDLVGLTIAFSGNEANAFNELLYQLSPIIDNLLDRNYNGLLNLLYRIDIPENKVAQLSVQNDFQSLAEALSDLIIRRELQKIVIRKHYKPED